MRGSSVSSRRRVSDRNRPLTMRADLSGEWLELTNRLALAAGVLAGTVHDVNNLLQGISGHAELFEAAPADDERQARRARLIVTSAGHASAHLATLQGFVRDVHEGTGQVDLHTIA